MSFRLALAAALLSCGGAQHAPPPADPGAQTKTYAPLALKADARVPTQAVIPGTDATGGSTLIHLAPAPRVVAAMVAGGLTAVELTAAPDPSGAPHVTGDLAGAWPAALAAATALDKDPTDLAFAITPHGPADGASALAAAGLVAAATGAQLDPRATLAGAIDPDGTIAPVDALAERFTAALASGKKRLGYPTGMRRVRDPASGKDVDLVELARARGAEAVEVADLGDAYALLTGRQLPRVVPVSEAEMALDPATVQALDAMYKEWQRRLATEWAAIVQLDTAGRVPKLLAAMRDRTKEYRDSAEQLRKRGKLAAAYSKMLAAAALAASTNQTYDVLSKLETGDVPGATAAIAAIDLAKLSRTTFDQIGALQPTTLAGHLAMLAAFETGVRGWAFSGDATAGLAAAKAYLDSLQGKTRAELGAHELADDIVDHIAPVFALAGQAAAQTTLATQEIALELTGGAHYTCAVADALRLAGAYQVADDAELGYLDHVMMEPLADKTKLALETTRTRFALVEPDYLVAAMAAQLPGSEGLPYEVKAAWGDHSLGWALLSLAAGELAYLDIELVIAKYLALGENGDERTGSLTIAHEPALAAMLVAAERTARAAARQARVAAGEIPVRAKLAYELASVEREGELGDRIDALGEYWAATLMSQTAVMLARNGS